MLWLQLQHRWPKWKENTLHTRHTIGIPSAYPFTRFHQLMQAPIGPSCLIFVSSRGAKLFFARVKSMASRFTQSKTHPRWQGGDTGYSKKRWHEIGMAAWPHGHCPSRCSALVQARMAQMAQVNPMDQVHRSTTKVFLPNKLLWSHALQRKIARRAHFFCSLPLNAKFSKAFQQVFRDRGLRIKCMAQDGSETCSWNHSTVSP